MGILDTAASLAVHQLTGVPRSQLRSENLKELATLFDTVAQSAHAVGYGTSSVSSDITATNQGAVLDAYQSTMARSINQLELLGQKAEATRRAHENAASAVDGTQSAMESVCVTAARTLSRLLTGPLPITQRLRIWNQTVNTTRGQLTQLAVTGTSAVDTAYAGILPIDTIQGLGEGHKRGTVPADVAAAYADLSPEDRMQFLRNLGDSFMTDWPAGVDKPEIIFYSNQQPQPPGTEPVPSNYNASDWRRYNGVRVGDTVYLNYDIGVEPPPNSHGTPNPPPPTLFSTTVHEIQHVRQAWMRDMYGELSQAEIDAMKTGSGTDIFATHGSTVHEVERFSIPYHGSNSPGYTHQPLEIDARRAGTEYLDNMTLEEMEALTP